MEKIHVDDIKCKNKLGFIDGSIQKPSSTSQDLKTWERCNDMVLSWMLNGIEKNLANNLIYCDTLHSLWLGWKNVFHKVIIHGFMNLREPYAITSKSKNH